MTWFIIFHFRLIHITDWLPTFVSMANGEDPQGIDGLNQWPIFTQGKTGIRSDLLYGIGDRKLAAYRQNDMKLLITAKFCGKGSKKMKTQLYDLGKNPSENPKKNLAKTKKGREIVEQLKIGLKKYCNLRKPAIAKKVKSRSAANSRKFGGIVSPGWCDAKPKMA